MAPPAEVVDAFYLAAFSGDAAAALALCAKDGQWHALSPYAQWRGSYPFERYVREVIPQAMAELPGYRIDSTERDELGELVVTRIRSSWADGNARREAAGVMVFRVADEQLTDIWVINSAGRDAPNPF